MSSSAHPAEPPATIPPDAHPEYYRGVLHELIEMGTALARSIHQEATADGATADVTVRFERVCRCVRRSILLARTLDTPVAVRDGQRAAARRRVIRVVEDRIDRAEEGEAAERLHGELLERLEGPELDDELASRPVEEVIRDICRDLGIEEVPGYHPWKRRTLEDVAVMAVRAAGEGARGGSGLRVVGRGRGPPP